MQNALLYLKMMIVNHNTFLVKQKTILVNQKMMLVNQKTMYRCLDECISKLFRVNHSTHCDSKRHFTFV